MIYDLQKGSLLKRASAFLLDGILLVILITGFAFAFSAIFHYNRYSDIYTAGLDKYTEQFGIDLSNVPVESTLTEEEKAVYYEAWDAMNKDTEMIRAFNMMIAIIVMELSFSIILSFMLLEFILPMILKNGQTVGKKIFGLGVMRTNGVRVRGVSLFIRTFLGKCVIETMVPAMIIAMALFSSWGIMPSVGLFGPIILMCLFVAQVILVFWTKKHMMIHDLLSDCIVVDLGSQMIFDSEQARTEYIARKAAEEAAVSPY